jgi:hypothetical protein
MWLCVCSGTGCENTVVERKYGETLKGGSLAKAKMWVSFSCSSDFWMVGDLKDYAANRMDG